MPDDATILSVLPPMSLHLCTLGPVNLLYDILETILEIVSTKLRADHWAKACGGLVRESYYGGKAQFNGPQCHKLLRSRHILVGLLIENELSAQCKPITNAFDRLYDMIQSCCGMVLYPRYVSDIRHFADSIFALMHFCEMISTPELPIKLNVIPKLHAIFTHIKQFIEYQKEVHNVEFGLAFYSEQRFVSSKSHN